MINWKDKFLEHGDLKDRRGRPKDSGTKATPELIEEIRRLCNNGSTPTSLRLISQEPTVNVSHWMVRKIIKKYLKFKPYHPRTLFHLYEAHAERVQFAEELTEGRNINHEFWRKIIFSDESWFTTGGWVNKHNTIFYAAENPKHINYAELHAQKVMVICFIGYNFRAGPFFFDRSLDADTHIDMLRTNFFNETVLRMFSEKRRIFQQDGAPAHTARKTRDFLNQMTDTAWIGRGSSFIAWPPHSPDLTPMDFFLWGYLKQRVYKQGISYRSNMEILKQTIIKEFWSIDQELINKACVKEFKERLDEVIRQNGDHITHQRENRPSDPVDYLFLNDVESARLRFLGLEIDPEEIIEEDWDSCDEFESSMEVESSQSSMSVSQSSQSRRRREAAPYTSEDEKILFEEETCLKPQRRWYYKCTLVTKGPHPETYFHAGLYEIYVEYLPCDCLKIKEVVQKNPPLGTYLCSLSWWNNISTAQMFELTLPSSECPCMLVRKIY